MSHSKTYMAFQNTVKGKAGRDALGFSDGAISEDGTIMVGDMGNHTKFTPVFPAKRPTYWPAPLPFPKMSYEDIKELVSIKASAQGASDGFYFPLELP